tara:strand:- start:605 stop:802 length:198 start_codon:yes stop_codon:yes gene_type:complete
MSIIDNLLRRIQKLEDDMEGIYDILEITEPEDGDIYSDDVICEDAYPDCECNDMCEDCDAEHVEQ